MKSKCILFIIFLFVGISRADQFKIIYRSGESIYNVSYSKVQVTNSEGQSLFRGYTDKYGRITISLQNGNYQGRVYYRKRWWNVDFPVDGRPTLKRIQISPE
jgi:hypothetical protein